MPKGHKHGGRFTPEYTTWINIKARCHNPNHHKFSSYGAVGIEVCERWRTSFENFLFDMRERPSQEHSIDRIDGSVGYCPSNCRWATRSEQSENRPSFVRAIEFDGKTQSIAAWAREVGINRDTLKHRLNKNWSVEAALTTPVKSQ